MAMIVGHSQIKYLDNFVTCPVFSYPGFTVRDILKETLDFYNVVPRMSLQSCTESEFDISHRSQSSGWETVGSSGRRTSSSRVPRASRAQSYVDVNCAPTLYVKTAIQNRRVYEVIRDIPSAPLSGGRYCPVSRASGKVKGTDHCTTKRKSASSTPKSSKSKRKDSVLINEHVILYESDSMFYLSTDVPSKLYGGGVETPIFSTTERVISYGEASCILESSQSDSITIYPPYKPKEGSVYLYCDSGDTSKKDDWKADGYTWRHNGRKEYKVEGKVIERHFFKIKNQKTASNDFQKHVFRYTSSDYDGKTVLAYYSNSSAYQSMPHGNRRNNNRPFKRTKPSVLHKIKEATLTKDEPKEILEKIRSEISPETKLKGVSAPRNLKQIQNSKQTIKTEKNFLTMQCLHFTC